MVPLILILLLGIVAVSIGFIFLVFYFILEQKGKRHERTYVNVDETIYNGVLKFLGSRGYRLDEFYGEDNVWTKRPWIFSIYIKPTFKDNTLAIEGWWQLRHGLFGTYEYPPNALLGSWDQIPLLLNLRSIDRGIRKRVFRAGPVNERSILRKRSTKWKKKVLLMDPLERDEFINNLRLEFAIFTPFVILGLCLAVNGIMMFLNSRVEPGQEGPDLLIMFCTSMIILPLIGIMEVVIGPHMILSMAPIYGMKPNEQKNRFMKGYLILEFGTIRNKVPLELVEDVRSFAEVDPHLKKKGPLHHYLLSKKKMDGIWYLPVSDKDRVLVLDLREKIPFTNIRTFSERHFRFRKFRTDRIFVDVDKLDHALFREYIQGN